ncbi:MAG: 30S ribosomal protein S16 [Phycisphaerae bacterium]
MAVRIRLKRVGRRHRPAYRLAVMDGRQARDSKVIEELGHFDPITKTEDEVLSVKRERVEYWLSVGAKPTDTVRQLLKKQGIGAGSVSPE